MHEERILCEKLRSKVMSVEEAAQFIKSGMTIVGSGFGPGYPRAVPTYLLEEGRVNDISLIIPATRGDELLGAWAESGRLSHFSSFQWSNVCHKAINDGKVKFVDCHLSQVAQKIRDGYYGHIDYAVVEISKINEDGTLIPGLSGGCFDTMVETAEHVILEINTDLPLNIEGIHDMHIKPGTLFDDLSKKQGVPYVKCDPDKISAIVFTDIHCNDIVYPDALPVHGEIAHRIVDFIQQEVARGFLPKNFTFQCGTGVVVNSVLSELFKTGLTGLNMYTEVLGDQALDALLDGTINTASTTALDLSGAAFQRVFDNMEYIKKHVAIRPVEFTNGAAQINNCELLALNGALEVDIYGNVNSSHTFGTHMMHGIGGSNDFCRNAKVSVFSTVSTSKKGAISRIVPMVSHVDNTEHDVDIIATEWGVADLRGLSPKERVPLMINCAHPDYRQQLWDYYNGAVKKCGPCQTPHDLSKAFSWYERYEKTGTMKE